MKKSPVWYFPAVQPHAGMPFANAVNGYLVWSGSGTLNVTVGRADFWDHRGGVDFSQQQTYKNIRSTLEQGDREALDKLFPAQSDLPGIPPCPAIISGGRFEFSLPKGRKPETGFIDLDTGVGYISFSGRGNATAKMTVDMDSGDFCIEWPDEFGTAPDAKPVPAYYSVADFAKRGIAAPEMIPGGWVQALPEDPALACSCRIAGRSSVISAVRGKTTKDRSFKFSAKTPAGIFSGAKKWWKKYNARIPSVSIPNSELQSIYDFGMYKFAGLTQPNGVAATLQGPWIEDYQLPPWSSDYHFNINVQMCYWPAYHSGLVDHLMPVFKMISGWDAQLKKNAKTFAGVSDGYMLPHAVDDHCRCMGNFWTGMMDHGCTMWMAEMMFRYVKYSGDSKFLKNTAFPFMRRAMNVFIATLDENKNGALSLPVGISPEYRGSAPNAWGPNASFQLAAAHRLAEDLIAAAQMLKTKPDPRWKKIQDKLPEASITTRSDGSKLIGLWDGLTLEESHRHHSHMAAVVPFDSIDCESPEWSEIIQNTFADWLYHGPAFWSGWCIPWASMLHSRVGNADAAELWIEIWNRFFVNEGHGTRHNAYAAGISRMGRRAVDPLPPVENEIMQMDAGMGAVAAVQEMLLHDKRGVNYIFKGAPAAWRNVSFRGMAAPGCVRVSAERKNGKTAKVEIAADRKTSFRLANPFKSGFKLVRKGKDEAIENWDIIDIQLAAGEKVSLTAKA